MKINFLFGITALLISCNPQVKEPAQNVSTTVSVIQDITDPPNYWVNPEQALQIFHCKETPDAACFFRLQSITDKRLNPITTYSLVDGATMEKTNEEDDPQYRLKSIATFFTRVKKAMTDFHAGTDTTSHLNNSECYRTICKEITYLATCNSSRRILIVVSDLQEKSDIGNFYQMNLQDTAATIKLLEGQHLLPKNLSELEVFFLFNAKDRAQDEKFAVAVQAYEAILQRRGVTVKVQANL